MGKIKICFASNNINKINELNNMLGSSFKIVGLKDLGITEDIPETGDTLEQNSALKAQYVFDRFQIPVFADDSGLLVDVLGGEPGVYSARYAGPSRDDEKNIDLLLEKLSHHSKRAARFETVITLIEGSKIQHQFKGTIHGEISLQRKGNNGFGYDPVFVPKERNCTFAEMTPEEKNQISHRYLAVKKLISHLKGK